MNTKPSIWKWENTASVAKTSIEGIVVVASLAAAITTILVTTNVIVGPEFLASVANPIGIGVLLVLAIYFTVKAISSYQQIYAMEGVQGKAGRDGKDASFAALISDAIKSGEIIEKKVQGTDGKDTKQLFLVLPINDYKTLVGNDKKGVHVLVAGKKVEVELAHVDPKDDASEYKVKVTKVGGKDQLTDMKTELGMSNSNSLKVAVSNQDLKALRANISAKLVDVAVEAAIEKTGKAA
ncbi:hypothetical protein [Wolbachia endosymbiont of Dirofilaria (Dirofilaria) immitis]|uniref:hypothetical protein n=1 Tax=Wolbachia endosymbiont of Dirofilaria (Dirofilaria) immitis TaxID=1812115 RepID=UPI00158F4CC0|nr:hypothetical protein [Wolbachia endosymbiont of Dirofilaria (Dirofilaria) immitis]QKX02414.1 hypothetical protein GOY12_02495 [Wolbachia endosymbiont of Dirofilaria (Dirofilaria) immitis]